MKQTGIRFADALGHEPADRRIDILRRIGAVGSISQAAREAGISYKAAWQALEILSNLAGTPLVKRLVGGSGGGGAILTPAGEHVLQAAEMLSKARADVLVKLGSEKLPGTALAHTAGLTLHTSMRNQLPCTVARLSTHGASIRVELTLADGASLFSKITRESAQLLGLHPGQAVLALCKATAVDIAKTIRPEDGYNLLHGKVTRVSRAKRGGEIAMRLADGLHLVGFAKPAHGLHVATSAMASFAELGVVIAISG